MKLHKELLKPIGSYKDFLSETIELIEKLYEFSRIWGADSGNLFPLITRKTLFVGGPFGYRGVVGTEGG